MILRYFSFLLVLLSVCSAFPVRVSRSVGEVAVDSVEGIASRVADTKSEIVNPDFVRRRESGVQGLGGSVMRSDGTTDPQVWTALANLERDSTCCFE